VIYDIFRGKPKFQKQTLTFWSELNNAITPLPIQTYFEAKNADNSANVALVVIADGLGISANTFKKYIKTRRSTTRRTTR